MNCLKNPVFPALVFAGATLAGGSAHAAPACDAVSSIERRIVEHADGDADALRAFVWRTSFVYRVNMVDVQQNLEKWRAAVECRRQTASAQPATVVARR